MTFFNKKTDVINFELTPYGREQLAQGALKPKYYEFDDSDVLYDIAHDGSSMENQEDVHNRIMNETPRLRNIILKSGVESNFTSVEFDEKVKDRHTNRKLTYDQRSVTAMGRSSYTATRAPTFQIQALKGSISGSTNYLTSSVVINMPIPQVEIDFNAYMSTSSVSQDSRNNYLYTSELFENGKFVILDIESPLLYIKELDSFYEKDNFEIEVYHIENDTIANQQQVEKLVPLMFNNNRSSIINGIYHDQSGEESRQSDWEIGIPSLVDPDQTEYYFDLHFDSGISREEVCNAIGQLPVKNQFLDKELKCPDQRTDRFDLYSTRVSPEDIEDCD